MSCSWIELSYVYETVTYYSTAFPTTLALLGLLSTIGWIRQARFLTVPKTRRGVRCATNSAFQWSTGLYVPAILCLLIAMATSVASPGSLFYYAHTRTIATMCSSQLFVTTTTDVDGKAALIAILCLVGIGEIARLMAQSSHGLSAIVAAAAVVGEMVAAATLIAATPDSPVSVVMFVHSLFNAGSLALLCAVGFTGDWDLCCCCLESEPVPQADPDEPAHAPLEDVKAV
jgi:hypothetical protein